jgi:hypothetical protein
MKLATRNVRHKSRVAGVPTIYVNDNFGQWRSDARKLVQYCLRPEATGLHFVEQLQPDDDDYFVLKPMIRLLIKRRSTSCCGNWVRLP